MLKELSELHAAAAAAGFSVTEICERAKVARSTPQRWKEGAGFNITTLNKLRTALKDLATERVRAMKAAGLLPADRKTKAAAG